MWNVGMTRAFAHLCECTCIKEILLFHKMSNLSHSQMPEYALRPRSEWNRRRDSIHSFIRFYWKQTEENIRNSTARGFNFENWIEKHFDIISLSSRVRAHVTIVRTESINKMEHKSKSLLNFSRRFAIRREDVCDWAAQISYECFRTQMARP